MELKLSDNQKEALIKAYEESVKLSDGHIQEIINPKITKAITIINELKSKKGESLVDIDSIKIHMNIAEEEAQVAFRSKTKSVYFKTIDTILDKLNKNNFEFTDKEITNIISVTDTYARVGTGQLGALREFYANIGNVDVGEFIAFANVLDKAGLKIGTTVPLNNRKLEDVYKINYDIHQVLRNHLAWKDHPEGGNTPAFSKPKKYSKEELLYVVDEDKKILPKAQVKSKGGKLGR